MYFYTYTHRTFNLPKKKVLTQLMWHTHTHTLLRDIYLQWRTQDFNKGGAKEVARVARENFKVPHPLVCHAHHFEL